jgi:hypothetical protein
VSIAWESASRGTPDHKKRNPRQRGALFVVSRSKVGDFYRFEIAIFDDRTGLSFTCIRCGHVMHLKCRNKSDHLVCVAGCGCTCGDGGLGSVDGISRTLPPQYH